MSETEVLIVGSGPAGINAAWPLVLAGIKVLMIDSGKNEVPSPPTSSINLLRQDESRWKYTLGENLKGVYLRGDYSPKLSTPIAQSVLNTDCSELHTNNFMAMRSATPGGLSTIWGGFCSQYDSNDMPSFPIASTDMLKAYESVANRIGISGHNDELASFHGNKLSIMPPVQLTSSANNLYKRYQEKPTYQDFIIGSARNAVITRDHNDRKGCSQCGLCLFGCANQSIYNSSDEIPKLEEHDNFKYLKNSPLKKIISANTGEQIISIEDGSHIKSKYLLLGAGTINTTAIVLEYAKMFDQKLKILTNPVSGMAFIYPKLIGNKLKNKTFSLGQLSYRLALSKSDYATGVIYGADTLPLETFASRMPFSRPFSMKLTALLTPALLPVTTYLSGKYSSNTISLSKNGDTTSINIEGKIPGNTKKQLKYIRKQLINKFKLYGAYYVPSSFTVSPPGSDAHLVGTIPAGGNGKLNCSNNCELNIAPNVYLIDGTWLPELPAKHCTFTIMANAYRVATNLAKKISLR